MESSKANKNGEFRRNYSWLECVCFVEHCESIDTDKLDILSREFSKLTIAGTQPRPGNLEQSIAWYQFDPEEEGRAAVWNRLLSAATSEWVLFLEQGEELRFYRLPEEDDLDPATWVPACIKRKDEKSVKNVYQVRMVHSGAKNPFAGRDLPDCTDYIMENGIHLYDRPIVLDRTTDGLSYVDSDAEMSIRNVSPKVYLVLGERLMDERKYVHAAAQYRKLLKAERLLPFDRLGAVNGLARCYTEQYKWPKAIHLAEKSIEAEPAQRIPYLILFRIHQLNKQWAEAYSALKAYHKQMGITSRSSFDIAMGEEETLNKLSEFAMKAGRKEEAFGFFEEMYADRGEAAGEEILRSLLMLSIELEKREQAIFYFKELFKDAFPDKMTGKQIAGLNDYMTMFMQNGWYVFAAEIYEELYTKFSDDPEYRRRLIVALSKTNRIEKARKLIAS